MTLESLLHQLTRLFRFGAEAALALWTQGQGPNHQLALEALVAWLALIPEQEEASFPYPACSSFRTWRRRPPP